MEKVTENQVDTAIQSDDFLDSAFNIRLLIKMQELERRECDLLWKCYKGDVLEKACRSVGFTGNYDMYYRRAVKHLTELMNEG